MPFVEKAAGNRNGTEQTGGASGGSSNRWQPWPQAWVKAELGGMLQAPSPDSIFILLQRDQSWRQQLKLQLLTYPGALLGLCTPDTSVLKSYFPLPELKKHWK